MLVLSSSFLFAQNANKTFKRSLRLLDNGNYVEARDGFESIFDLYNDKNEIASFLSECYFELHQEDKIVKMVNRLQSPDSYNLFDLASAYYYKEQFDSAASIVRKIAAAEGLDPDSLRSKIQSSSDFYADEDGFLIQNFGEDINSTQREYSSVMYNDYNTLLFTSRGETDEKVDFDGMAFESIFLTTIDSAGDWTQPVPIKSNIENEKRHDAPIQVINEGKTMISFHDGKLYESNLEDGAWVRSKEIELNTNFGFVTHCYITKDQQTIYFASDLKLPGGDLDLYMAKKLENGDWSEPEPLDDLNTRFDEDAPFLAGDGIFYFSSRGHGSIGGHDVFKTTYDSASNSWAKPESLGYPINTVDEDLYYSMEGKVGYISSSRNHGEGSLDIYRVFLFNKVKVEGKVLNDEGGPIPDVRIDFEYDSSLVYAYTDIEGDYELFLPVSTNMHVTFVKDSLNLYEGDYIVNVTFKDKNNNIFTFAITDEEMPKNEVSYEAPEGIDKIPIDVRNDFNPNPILAKVPRKLEKRWADSLNAIADANKAKRDEINKIFDKSKVEQVIYFESNKREIRPEYQKILDEVIKELKKDRNFILYLDGYTDYIGTKTYNLKLSFRRSRAVFDYLVDQGIDENKLRIQAKGELDGSELWRNRKVEIKWQSNE